MTPMRSARKHFSELKLSIGKPVHKLYLYDKVLQGIVLNIGHMMHDIEDVDDLARKTILLGRALKISSSIFKVHEMRILNWSKEQVEHELARMDKHIRKAGMLEVVRSLMTYTLDLSNFWREKLDRLTDTMRPDICAKCKDKLGVLKDAEKEG